MNQELTQRAKDYLCQIKKTDRLIQRINETVSTLRSNLISPNLELKPDKIQTTRKTDQMAETIAKIVDLEKDMNVRIDELIDMKREAFNLIGKIPDFDQQNVLIGRYIQLKKWEIIAEELDFSTQWVYEIHGKALIAFSTQNVQFLENRVKQSEPE